MKLFRAAAATLVVALALGGCGGGGGGGNGPAGSGGSSEGSGGNGGTTAPASALVLTVRINDATRPASDSYDVKDGDTVEVSSSKGVTWKSTSPDVQLSIKSVSDTTWKVGLTKKTAAAASVVLSASDGGSSKTLTFNLPATDARNGTYKVYATNGSRLDLKLDFDTKTYSFSNSSLSEASASGTFSADDAESGTFVFNSPRVATATNTARFRVMGDTVLGAFPFVAKQKSESTYEVRPFVASRALATDRSKFDGVYNRFGINLSPLTSNISQFEISGGGTTLRRCDTLQIYRIATCPTASVLTYTIAPGVTEGTWSLVDSTNKIAGSFGMAPINGKYVLLMAGIPETGLPDTLFRIGLPETPDWPTGHGYGSATSGSWGEVDLLGNGTSTRKALAADGTTPTASNAWSSPWSDGPYGVRSETFADRRTYFAAQSAGIFAIVGANDPATAGYLQLNLLD